MLMPNGFVTSQFLMLLRLTPSPAKHLLTSIFPTTSHFLHALSTASYLSKTVKCFYIEENLTAGAEAGLHIPAKGEKKTAVEEAQLRGEAALWFHLEENGSLGDVSQFAHSLFERVLFVNIFFFFMSSV